MVTGRSGYWAAAGSITARPSRRIASRDMAFSLELGESIIALLRVAESTCGKAESAHEAGNPFLQERRWHGPRVRPVGRRRAGRARAALGHAPRLGFPQPRVRADAHGAEHAIPASPLRPARLWPVGCGSGRYLVRALGRRPGGGRGRR